MEPILFPLYLSLKVATIATIIAFFVSVLLAWIIVYKPNRWTNLMSYLVMLPLVLPPTVLGYYLLLLIGRDSWIGQTVEALTGQPLVFTWKAAVIAAAIAALPLVIRPIQLAFESIERELLKVAELEGANRWQVFLHIILPLSYKGLIAGAILGFARAMGEFGATLMVAGNIPGKTQTLSIAIYDAVQANRMADAHMMVLILSGVTIFFIVVVSGWFKQK